MPGTGYLIEAHGADLAYDGGPVVMATIDLELPAGELVIVLGPNGGGKTTLFRAILGELSPTAGEIAVHAPVAYLPQHDASRLDFPVSALDVALMGTLRERRPWQLPRKEHRARAAAALGQVGLSHALGTQYGELSGGQRRRVLLARTIVQRSPIVLLDEPLAGVDPASAEVIRETLVALRDQGRLVLVASHDIEHARQADRVICVHGRVVADGPPDTALNEQSLRDTYATELTVFSDGSFAAVEHHHHHH